MRIYCTSFSGNVISFFFKHSQSNDLSILEHRAHFWLIQLEWRKSCNERVNTGLNKLFAHKYTRYESNNLFNYLFT